MDDNKKKSLDAALKSLDKAFGKGTILRLGDKEIEQIDSIGTGSVGLDLALGIGGVPKGRIIEIYGPESSGKTTLTLHIIAECQKAGGVCAFIDAEHALDVKYAKIWAWIQIIFIFLNLILVSKLWRLWRLLLGVGLLI